MQPQTIEQLSELCQQYCNLQSFEYLNFRDKIKKYVFELNNLHYDNFANFNTYLELEDVYRKNDQWYFLYTVYFTGHNEKYFSIEIPVEYYFYTKEQLDEIVNEVKLEREQEKQRIEEANKLQQRDTRYQQYLKLKAEFEVEN